MSEKRDKFRLLAERRTNAAIESIARIGKLSNRHAYEFDDKDIAKIIRALRSAVNDVETRFQSPSRKSGTRFTL